MGVVVSPALVKKFQIALKVLVQDGVYDKGTQPTASQPQYTG